MGFSLIDVYVLEKGRLAMSKDLVPGHPNITEGLPPWLRNDETLIVSVPQPRPSTSEKLPDTIAKDHPGEMPGNDQVSNH